MMSSAALSLAGVGWWVSVSQSYVYFLGTLIITVLLTSLVRVDLGLEHLSSSFYFRQMLVQPRTLEFPLTFLFFHLHSPRKISHCSITSLPHPSFFQCAQEEPLEFSEPVTRAEIFESYQISFKSHGDFFWVFLSRTLYYAAVMSRPPRFTPIFPSVSHPLLFQVSVQTFLYFYCRDVIHLQQTKKYTAVLCLIGFTPLHFTCISLAPPTPSLLYPPTHSLTFYFFAAQITAASVSLLVGHLSPAIGKKPLIYVACFVMMCVYIGWDIFSHFLFF